MAVNKNLTKEQILAKWNSKTDEFPTLEELDTMAFYNEEYLKENGWEQREGIGFYFNDKYKTDRFTYWIDCNTVQFTAYRFDNESKENNEVGSYDARTEQHMHHPSVETFITWLDTAIGHEEEYCISLIMEKHDLERLPGKIKEEVEKYRELCEGNDIGDSYYKAVYGCCIRNNVDKLHRNGVPYVMTEEVKNIYNEYKDYKDDRAW